MKRIALFVHNLTVEYSLLVAQGIASYFTKDKDVKVILAQTNQPHYPHGLYEYQYWASAELLKAEDIDLIMIVSSAYQTFIAPEELKTFLKPFTKKPIVLQTLFQPLRLRRTTRKNTEYPKTALRLKKSKSILL